MLTATGGPVRLTAADQGGSGRGFELMVAAGETRSVTVYLPAGTYSLKTQSGSGGPASFVLRRKELSDPVGPQAVTETDPVGGARPFGPDRSWIALGVATVRGWLDGDTVPWWLSRPARPRG